MPDLNVLQEAARILRERGWEAGLAFGAGGPELIVRVEGRCAIVHAQGTQGIDAERLADAAEELLGSVN